MAFMRYELELGWEHNGKRRQEIIYTNKEQIKVFPLCVPGPAPN